MKTENTSDNKQKPVDTYPGVAINVGDDDKVSERLVDERTKTQNNNPRNDYEKDN